MEVDMDDGSQDRLQNQGNGLSGNVSRNSRNEFH